MKIAEKSGARYLPRHGNIGQRAAIGLVRPGVAGGAVGTGGLTIHGSLQSERMALDGEAHRRPVGIAEGFGHVGGLGVLPPH